MADTAPKYEGKNWTIAIALALLVGSFRIHRFYVGEYKKGILYAVFFWTTVPFFLALYDAYKYYRNSQWVPPSETTVRTNAATDGTPTKGNAWLR